jgi:hypothetical protein
MKIKKLESFAKFHSAKIETDACKRVIGGTSTTCQDATGGTQGCTDTRTETYNDNGHGTVCVTTNCPPKPKA